MKNDTLGEVVLRYRRAIGGALILVTLFSGYGAASMNVSTRFMDFFPTDHKNVALSKRFNNFGGGMTLAVMVQVRHGDIFNFDTLRKIQQITFEIDRLPGVNHLEVFSLSSFRIAYARATPGALDVKPFMFPSVPHGEKEIEAFKRCVFTHRELVRHLISNDNKSTLITAKLNDGRFEYAELFDGIQRIVRKYQDARHVIYLTGEPVVRGYGYHYLPVTVGIFVLACVIMVLAVYASLGEYTSWWVPVLTSSCAAVWGIGFVGLMGYSFDPLMLVVPFILTARDMSHAIRWQRRYYCVLNQVEERDAACVRTTNLMLTPGLVAIAADITGIVFISFSGIPVLDHLARAGVVWLSASALMVFIFQPILISYLPMPRDSWKCERKRELARRFEPLIDRIVEVPVTPGLRRNLLLFGSAGLLGLGVISALRIQVGYKHAGTPIYRHEAKVNMDTEAISRKFPVEEGWVLLTTPSYPDGQSVLAPNVLRLADHLRGYLLDDPAVMQVISFASTVIRPFNQMFHYGHPKFFGMPRNPQQAGNLWFEFLAGTAPGEMQHYIPNTQAKETCIRVLLRDHTRATLDRIQYEIATFFRSYADGKSAYSRVTVSYLGGIAGLYAAANDVLYRVAMVNIALVLSCVFVFCTALCGSWLAGFIFVFSCVLANFTAFTYLYLSGINLTIDSVPVISLTIGLGIDYGISAVSCMRAEMKAGHRLDDAVRLALKTAGASVLTTSCVSIGGILPWVLSPAQFHHQMAVLLTILLVTNVLVGIWFVPAFISWSGPGFITRHQWTGEEAIERRLAAKSLAAS